MTRLLSIFETQRLALQAMLDHDKSLEERNRLGQFATPTALAQAILAHSLSFLPAQQTIKFLDPVLGTGSFYSALQTMTSTQPIERACGIEIDPHYALPARDLWSPTPLHLQMGDFTTLQPPSDEHNRFNLLVCNPPYVRHHHLESSDKVRLQALSEAVFGQRIDGLAGLYCYFIARAHAWMAQNAIAAWLIPSEFMTVNYGRVIKHYLLAKVTLLHIHRFDPNDGQFADALVSSAVVFLRNTPPSPDHRVTFTYGGPLDKPAVTKQVAVNDLREESKWTRFPVADVRTATTGPMIRDFFRITRGLVTGDNRFFILTPEQITAHDIPAAFLRPILPSPRYLDEDEVFADKDGNPSNTKRLFLLDCSTPEAEVKAKYPALWTYLQTGVPQVSERYVCSKRRPWYSQERRSVTPFVCTYLGRSDTKRGRPFRIILNHSQATAANVYLLLYPNPTLAQALAEDAGLTHAVWQILNTIQPNAFLDEGRVYGGGLHKLEPSELAKVSVPQLRDLLAHLSPEQLALSM